jgi:hypothetical protein
LRDVEEAAAQAREMFRPTAPRAGNLTPMRAKRFSDTKSTVEDRPPHDVAERQAETRAREKAIELLTPAELAEAARADVAEGNKVSFNDVFNGAVRQASSRVYDVPGWRGNRDRLKAQLDAAHGRGTEADAVRELQLRRQAEAVENRLLDLELEQAVARGDVVEHEVDQSLADAELEHELAQPFDENAEYEEESFDGAAYEAQMQAQQEYADSIVREAVAKEAVENNDFAAWQQAQEQPQEYGTFEGEPQDWLEPGDHIGKPR